MTLARIASIAVALALCLADRAGAWEFHHSASVPDVPNWGTSVAIDGAGDVFAGGIQTKAGYDVDFTVVKLGGADGKEIWRREIDGTHDETDNAVTDSAFHVKVDGRGDVVAAGVLRNSGTQTDVAVIKFDGSTGTEIWRTVIDGALHDFDAPGSIAIDPSSGDVLVPSILLNTSRRGTFTVHRLAAETGAELWRTEVVGNYDGSRGNAAAIDAEGNVVVAGETHHEELLSYDGWVYPHRTEEFTVAKLEGTTGREIWRSSPAEGTDGTAYAVSIDRAGDVIAAGKTGEVTTAFSVFKLTGSTGATLWSRFLPTTRRGSGGGVAWAMALDSKGNVAAAGYTDSAYLAVTKLLGSTGEIAWTSPRRRGTGLGVAVDGNDDVFTTGYLGGFLLQKSSGETGKILWRRRWTGKSTVPAQSLGLAVDPAGDVVTTGSWRLWFKVVKACGRDGRTRTSARRPCAR